MRKLINLSIVSLVSLQLSFGLECPEIPQFDLALNEEEGENALTSAVIDTQRGFAYFGTETSPGRIVKVNLADFSRVGSLILNGSEDNLASAVIDTVNGFAYFGTGTSPGQIVKIDLKTPNNSPPVRVGSIQLNRGDDFVKGEDFVATAVIDSQRQIGYFGTTDGILKINLDTFTRVGAEKVPLVSGEKYVHSGVIDVQNGFAYFGVWVPDPLIADDGFAKIVKVRVGPFGTPFERVGEISLAKSVGALTSAVIDPTRKLALFGTAKGPAQILRLNLNNNFAVNGSITLGADEKSLTSAVIDIPGDYAYFGTRTEPPYIIKIRLSIFARPIDSQIPVQSTSSGLTSAVIDPSKAIAYFGMHTTPGHVQKVIVGSRLRVESITPNSGSTEGGTDVSITGTNFDSSSLVQIGGTPATSVGFVNENTLRAKTPEHLVQELVNVMVTNSDFQCGENMVFTYVAPRPQVTSVTRVDDERRSDGPDGGGTRIIISGNHFRFDDYPITIGGVEVLDPQFLDSNTWQARTPGGPPGFHPVVVRNMFGKTSNPDLNGTFQYILKAPELEEPLTVNSGPTSGDTSVQIRGKFISYQSKVTFGGQSENSFTYGWDEDETVLNVTTPEHLPLDTAARVDVKVQNPSTLSDTLVGGYLYLPPPIVAANGVVPDRGPLRGGTDITITGRNFRGGTGSDVTIEGVSCNNINFVSSTRITATTPEGSTVGEKPVLVINSDQQRSDPGAFTYEEGGPVLNQLSETSGPTGGGNVITLEGENFKEGAHVVVDSLHYPDTTRIDSTHLQITMPCSTGGEKDVVVFNPDGASSAAKKYEYIYIQPTLSEMSPISGPVNTTTEVRLTGTNFDCHDRVRLVDQQTGLVADEVDVTFTPGDTNHVVFYPPVPDCPIPKTFDIVLVHGDGSTATAPTGFTYLDVPPAIDSLWPTSGLVSVAKRVVINGSNFQDTENLKVYFGDIREENLAKYISFDNCRQLTVTTPARPTPGKVDVTVLNREGFIGICTVELCGGYEYLRPPPIVNRINGVVPAEGPTAGGTPVVVTGANFYNDGINQSQVFIGGSGTVVKTLTPTEITLDTPEGSPGLADVVVVNPDTQSSDPDHNGSFTYYQPPIITSISPTAGPIGGGIQVTIDGEYFVNKPVVYFGTIRAVDIVFANSQQLTMLAPEGVVGPVDIRVVNPDGHDFVFRGGFQFQDDPPTMGTINPDHGWVGGGDTITIIGTNFISPATVTIDDRPAVTTFVSETTLRAVTPEGRSAGAKDVVVTNPDGQSVTKVGGFTYEVDNTPPEITNVSAVPNSNSASITWITDKPSDSQVIWGLTTSYGGSTTIDSNRVTSHSVMVPGLLSGKNYHYRVLSRDMAGNRRVSVDFVFNTSEDRTPPTVSLTAPATGSTLNGLVTIIANATDNFGINRVEFYKGGTYLGQTTVAPYSFDWFTMMSDNGSPALSAKAFDAAGNVATSAPITITINNTSDPPLDATPPGLTILSPSAGEVFTSPGITISGNASDASGLFSVTVNGMPASGATSWSKGLSLVSGANTITVVATDNSSRRNTTTRSVTVTYEPEEPDPAACDTTPSVADCAPCDAPNRCDDAGWCVDREKIVAEVGPTIIKDAAGNDRLYLKFSVTYLTPGCGRQGNLRPYSFSTGVNYYVTAKDGPNSLGSYNATNAVSSDLGLGDILSGGPLTPTYLAAESSSERRVYETPDGGILLSSLSPALAGKKTFVEIVLRQTNDHNRPTGRQAFEISYETGVCAQLPYHNQVVPNVMKVDGATGDRKVAKFTIGGSPECVYPFSAWIRLETLWCLIDCHDGFAENPWPTISVNGTTDLDSLGEPLFEGSCHIGATSCAARDTNPNDGCPSVLAGGSQGALYGVGIAVRGGESIWLYYNGLIDPQGQMGYWTHSRWIELEALDAGFEPIWSPIPTGARPISVAIQSNVSPDAMAFASASNLDVVGNGLQVVDLSQNSMESDKTITQDYELQIRLSAENKFLGIGADGTSLNLKGSADIVPELYRQTSQNTFEKVSGQLASAGQVKAGVTAYGQYQLFVPKKGGSATPSGSGPPAPPVAFGEVFVFPNPTRSGNVPTLYIEIEPADNISFRIYDVSGGLVYENRIESAPLGGSGKSSYEQTLPTNQFHSGIYHGMVTAEKSGQAPIRKKFSFSVIK